MENVEEHSVSVVQSDASLEQKRDTTSDPKEASDGRFNCNICLGSVHDPVVTFCGHLYCWVCIYNWIHVQESSPDTYHGQKCAVCKGPVSTNSLVPLYVRGGDPNTHPKMPNPRLVVPPRPRPLHSLIDSSTSATENTSVPPGNDQPTHPNTSQHVLDYDSLEEQLYLAFPYGGYSTLESPDDTTGSLTLRTAARSIGLLVHGHIFPGSAAGVVTHHDNLYHMGSRGLRRQDFKIADKFLFIFCCFVLCLFLF